jgi:hypothetical protein
VMLSLAANSPAGKMEVTFKAAAAKPILEE